MAGTEIKIKAADGGSFMGYLAKPKSGKGPGIVVIQEIFGVNKVMRDLTDGFAAAGYVALCPDLFWRQQPGIQLTDKSEAEWKRAFELFQGFNIDKGVADLGSTLDALRKVDGCTGKAGCVGYCLGGRLAYLMAARTGIDASVGYYGVYIQEHLGEAKNIKKPLMLHVAAKDQFVPPEAQAKIRDGLKGHAQVTIHTYANQDHAFARVGGDHYDKAAADLANQRTADFFKKNLG
ncbi:MAG TPA: dienelactone hydrolase family protein [Candidatus Cybelea sp.]|nr:dienelactone hydrolase family protein [Candidatus Cybelea sp.]